MAINFMKVRTGVGLRPNSAPSSPENGDMYYDSGTNKFRFYQNGAWVEIPSAVNVRAGSQSVSSGVATQSITFSSPLSDTNYAISAMWRNTTDANPQFQPLDVTAKTASGFTLKWNANTDSANYVIEYIAIPNA